MFLCHHGVCGILHNCEDVLVSRATDWNILIAHKIRYMFLLERAHVIRAPFISKRIDDWVWLGGTITVCLSFGAISIWGLITPHAELSPVDGQCRIGLSTIPAYLLLIFDALINTALTAIFVVLLRPVLEFRQPSSASYDDGSPQTSVKWFKKIMQRLGSLGFEDDERSDHFFVNMKKVLWKNVVGSVVTSLASAANLIVFFSEKSSQLAFVCLVSCMADGKFHKPKFSWETNVRVVTCGVLIVHWLTLGSSEEVHVPRRSNGNDISARSSWATNAAVSIHRDDAEPSEPSKPEG